MLRGRCLLVQQAIRQQQTHLSAGHNIPRYTVSVSTVSGRTIRPVLAKSDTSVFAYG